MGMLLSFLIISIATEHLFEHFEHKFRNQQGFKDVLTKIKDELMLMGFISLLLVVFQDDLTKTCIPHSLDVGVPEDICIEKYPEFHSSAASSAASSTAASSASASSASSSSVLSTSSTAGSQRRMLLNVFGPSNENATLTGSRRMAAAVASTCLEGQTSMLDAAAIHHVHILIFVIACTHITYSIILIQMSEMVIRRWTGWEHWGDDDNETLDRMKIPVKFKNGCHAVCAGLFGQFSNPVSPFKYISLRRFYLTKNKHPTNFNFADHLIEGLESDFHELVGISWWMWLILMAQVMAEGYGFGQYNLFAALSLIQTIGVGMYCSAVVQNLASQIYIAYGGKQQGGSAITQEMLDKIQSRTQNHKNILRDVEPNMLCLKTFSTLKLNIRFVMFQNSTSLAQAMFFFWQIGSHACYFDIRNDILYIINLSLNIVMLFHNSLVTVPLYSIVAHLDYHSNPPKAAQGHGHEGHGGESTKVQPTQDTQRTLNAKAFIKVNDLFQHFDVNNDGHIDSDEFQTLTVAMQKKHDESKSGDFAGGPITVRDCEAIFSALDTSVNGELDKDEFVTWVATGLTKTPHECEEFAGSGPLQRKLMNFLQLIREEIGLDYD